MSRPTALRETCPSALAPYEPFGDMTLRQAVAEDAGN